MAHGNPLDPVNRVGALVSPAHFEKVSSYLAKGPKVLMGGKADKGFVEPTILDIADRNAHKCAKNLSGPCSRC